VIATRARAQSAALSLAPVGVAVALALLDRDFWFAVPLTALLTFVAGGASLLLHRQGRWSIHALVGGIVGWIASVAALMNLEI
jgi:hypothetical protein